MLGIDGNDQVPIVWTQGTSAAQFASDIHQLLACVGRADAHRPAPALLPALLPDTIPSPSDSVWYVGPVPIRGYALSIIVGIVAAIWIGERRWVARGGRPGEVSDVAVWAVPFGVIGGRIYHVITDNDLYFGAGGHPIEALYIWRGGLGVWGAIAFGAVGVLHRLPAARHQVAADGRRAGAGRPDRPGAGPLGQLVQPGALRHCSPRYIPAISRAPSRPGRGRSR